MQIITPNELNSIENKIKVNFDRVALVLDRNKSLISAMYNCFNKQITYVPVDPNYPLSRIEKMLNEAEVNTVITHKRYIEKVRNANVICIDENEYVDFDAVNTNNILSCILFTSGSTGTPKGVQVTREGLFNFIDGISSIIDFSHKKRIVCLTTVSFDIFFLESIMALYKGLTVILANEEEQRNPRFMAQLILDNAVDMVQMTPSRMQLLLNHDKELTCLKNVKEIMIGGEQFPLSLLHTLQEKTTAKIYNMYGPTETTIWSTVSDLTFKDRIDIGRPIKNTEVYIVDGNLSILPDGEVGEICVAGNGLAKGYVGRNDLTKERFIYLSQNHNIRAYRTGDVGRYMPDGDLQYLGRTDNQVKIRGHRIELEEIETYLNQFKGINQSVVIATEKSETDKVLEAFYTSDNHIDTKDIISYLSSNLPDYMIPAIFKRVESFIQTTNGKIDRKKVLECIEVNEEYPSSKDWNTTKLNDTQAKIFQIIASNLNSEIGDVTLETGFSDAGVDSITFIKIVVAMEGEFGFEFDDEMLLITAFATIKSMIEYVEMKIK